MITRYVNTASTAGGDGTTNATSGSTRAFASLREALDSLPGTLTDAVTINCEGTAADTLNCTQTHWDIVTSPTNRIRIIGNNTAGKWNTSAYRLEVSNESAIYNNDAAHVTIERLQIQITTTTGNAGDHSCFRLRTANNNVTNGAPDHKFLACIARAVQAGGTGLIRGFNDSNGGVNGTVRRINCIAYGGCRVGFQSDGATTNPVENYNCTSYGNQSNYEDNQISVNCIGAGFTANGDFFFSGSTGHDYNASSDDSAEGTHSRINQTFAFVDAANGDFHLLSSDTGAKDFGLTDPLSGVYNDDIDGQVRTGAWDIGADEFQLAAGTPFFTALGAQRVRY